MKEVSISSGNFHIMKYLISDFSNKHLLFPEIAILNEVAANRLTDIARAALLQRTCRPTSNMSCVTISHSGLNVSRAFALGYHANRMVKNAYNLNFQKLQNQSP